MLETEEEALIPLVRNRGTKAKITKKTNHVVGFQQTLRVSKQNLGESLRGANNTIKEKLKNIFNTNNDNNNRKVFLMIGLEVIKLIGLNIRQLKSSNLINC